MKERSERDMMDLVSKYLCGRLLNAVVGSSVGESLDGSRPAGTNSFEDPFPDSLEAVGTNAEFATHGFVAANSAKLRADAVVRHANLATMDYFDYLRMVGVGVDFDRP